LLPIADLDIPVPIYLIWRKDNQSPLLQRFIAQVQSLVRPSDDTSAT
jgi:DNA-binding transcriptional LysR family regulator